MNKKVENIDSEDAEFFLKKIEKSFTITFGDNELVHIKTLGEFCDHVANKIQLQHSDDCTTRQAFYKLRNIFVKQFNIDRKIITPNFPLEEILPRNTRRSKISVIENNLGFQLKILRLPLLVTNALFIVLLVCIAGLFFNREYALLGLFIAFGGLWLGDKIGNELDVQTVGQLAKKIATENYIQSRRNPQTFNKNEIEKLLIEWFRKEFRLNKLTRESKFI